MPQETPAVKICHLFQLHHTEAEFQKVTVKRLRDPNPHFQSRNSTSGMLVWDIHHSLQPAQGPSFHVERGKVRRTETSAPPRILLVNILPRGRGRPWEQRSLKHSLMKLCLERTVKKFPFAYNNLVKFKPKGDLKNNIDFGGKQLRGD